MSGSLAFFSTTKYQVKFANKSIRGPTLVEDLHLGNSLPILDLIDQIRDEFGLAEIEPEVELLSFLVNKRTNALERAEDGCCAGNGSSVRARK